MQQPRPRTRASAWPRRRNCRSRGTTRRAARAGRAGASGACGLMSRMATKPSVAATWSPRGTACRRGNRQAARIPSSETAPPRTRTSSPTGADPRRATASSRRRSRGPGGRRGRGLRDRSSSRQRARQASCDARAQPGAALLLTCRRDRVVACRDGAGARRVREDVDLRQAGVARGAQRVRERASSSVGKPTITSLVRLNSSCSGASRRRYVATRVAAAHRAEDSVVPGLERHVQVPAHRRRLVQRGDQRVVRRG